MRIVKELLSRPNLVTDIRHDFLSSIVVFLVALPLCMGIAIASGAPVAAGLITGIVAGLIVSWVSGCPLSVSGPAAGLTVIVYDIIQELGLEMLGLVVLLAGVMQVAAGLFRLGQWFRAVSPAVIRGMLAGIGVLIFASQFHVMVDDKPKGSGIDNLITIPEAVWKGVRDLPRLGKVEVREEYTELLREVGELHRQQVLIEERVAERIPHHEKDEELSMIHAHKFQLSDEDQDALGDQQHKIVAELEKIKIRVNDLKSAADDDEKVAKIEKVTEEAIEETKAAENAIRRQYGDDMLTTQKNAIASLKSLLDRQKNHSLAAEIGIATIIIIIVWQLIGQKLSFLKIVPGALVAVLVATVAAALLVLPVLYVEVPANLLDDLHVPFTWTVLTDAPWVVVLQSAVLIAAVASAESLLCATAVDQMHHGTRTKYDRELFAQGVGNTICGALGALPMTGVIVRSSANIQAGGRTRLASFFHGLWLLLFVAALAFLLRMIPTSSLAAVLVFTGYKLVNPRSILSLRKFGWSEVGIYAATVAGIVVIDLLSGVMIGIALAAAKLLYTFSHLVARLDVSDDRKQATLSLEGAATFVRLPRLAKKLEDVPPSAELYVVFHELAYIDHACLDLLVNWARQHEATGGKLVIDWESLHARFRPERGRIPEKPSARNGGAHGNDRPSESKPDSLSEKT